MIDPTWCVALVKITDVPLHATDVANAASSPMKFNDSSILLKVDFVAILSIKHFVGYLSWFYVIRLSNRLGNYPYLELMGKPFSMQRIHGEPAILTL